MNGSEPQTQRRRQRKSVDAIDAKFITRLIGGFSILVIILAVLGQIELLIGIFVIVCIGIAWWALRLDELSTSRAEQFRDLRRIARLRNEDSPKPSAVAIFGVAVVFALFFCWNLSASWKQYCAATLPMVKGQITRHGMVDIALGSQLEVDYEYLVDGKRYRGNQLRFVYRAFRVRTEGAKKLAATWKVGNAVCVFYTPTAPAKAVLDNTFCKGDQLQVGLNGSGLMLSFIVMIGAACVQLRTHETEINVDASTGAVVIQLSNIPLLGAFAVFIAIGALILTFIALLGGLISMGNSEIPWLVTTIDCLYVITAALFVIASTIYVGERASFGISGRQLVIDEFKRTLSSPSETFGETVSHDFAQVKSVQVVSNREDWYRMGRTFSVVALCETRGGRRKNRTLQRSYRRRDAVALAALVKNLIAPDTNDVTDFEVRQDADQIHSC